MLDQYYVNILERLRFGQRKVDLIIDESRMGLGKIVILWRQGFCISFPIVYFLWAEIKFQLSFEISILL